MGFVYCSSGDGKERQEVLVSLVEAMGVDKGIILLKQSVTFLVKQGHQARLLLTCENPACKSRPT